MTERICAFCCKTSDEAHHTVGLQHFSGGHATSMLTCLGTSTPVPLGIALIRPYAVAASDASPGSSQRAGHSGTASGGSLRRGSFINSVDSVPNHLNLVCQFSLVLNPKPSVCIHSLVQHSSNARVDQPMLS